MTNHYDILGVPRNASDQQLRAAFRQKAKQYHPDVCSLPDAQARFVAVYTAYEILADATKRRVYDTLLSAAEPVVTAAAEYGQETQWEQEARQRGADLAKKPLKTVISNAVLNGIAIGSIAFPAVMGALGVAVGAFNILGGVFFAIPTIALIRHIRKKDK